MLKNLFFDSARWKHFFEPVTAMLTDNRWNNNKAKGKVFWLETVNQIHKNTVFVTYFTNIVILKTFLN